VSRELLAALCLVLVIEGLMLFGAPGWWKRMAAQLQGLPDKNLRLYGAAMAGLGLILLQLAR
jgi:uncharacterized protein